MTAQRWLASALLVRHITRSWCSTCLLAAILAVTGITVGPVAPVFGAPAPDGSGLGQRTLTNDWFGQGQAWRDAGFDFRLEWSQFDQGLTEGAGDNRWAYGGKWDAQLRVDLSKLGFWNGLSLTAQAYWNYGASLNGIGGPLTPVNAALFFPGANTSDIMALYVTQTFGNLYSVLVGKLNLIEFARGVPLLGGGGVDTFWNENLAAPITGVLPATINGVQVRINTQPVSYTLTVFDPQDATTRPLFSDLFAAGVGFWGAATFKTTVAGHTGYYGIKVVYSTKAGPDLSDFVESAINGVTDTKAGSYFVGLTMQQYLVQDPRAPGRGWGVFAEIDKADGNPNLLEWSGYVGVGGNSLIPSRPDDRFGIAYFYTGISNTFKTDLASTFNLVDESGVEAFYNVAITPWFRVTGDLQFVKIL
jgi:porin